MKKKEDTVGEELLVRVERDILMSKDEWLMDDLILAS